MEVLFTHNCPHCLRKRRMTVNALGALVHCLQCGQPSTATDPSNESLAMKDRMHFHAELAPEPRPSNVRTPR